MSTYTLISSQVLGSSAASVTFSSIPSTYKDLVIRFSARDDGTYYNYYTYMSFNSSTTGYSDTSVYGVSGSVASFRDTGLSYIKAAGMEDSGSATASTFSSSEVYIPNYATSAYKPLSAIGVTETNSANQAFTDAAAGLWQSTSAINSITLTQGGGTNFVTGSSFYLYGV